MDLLCDLWILYLCRPNLKKIPGGSPRHFGMLFCHTLGNRLQLCMPEAKEKALPQLLSDPHITHSSFPQLLCILSLSPLQSSSSFFFYFPSLICLLVLKRPFTSIFIPFPPILLLPSYPLLYPEVSSSGRSSIFNYVHQLWL